MKKLFLVVLLLMSSFSFAQQTLIPFQKGGKWGVISSDGKILIEPQYKDIKRFCSEGIALVFDFKSRRWLFIDAGNNEIKMPYKNFEPKKYFGFGQKGFVDGVTQLLVGDKLALVNTKGEEVFPPNFEKISEFHEGIAIGKIGATWYLLDLKGNKTEIQAKAIEVDLLKNGFAPFRTSSKTWGFVNAEGAVVIKAQFLTVGYFYNGLAWARTMDEKIGFINTKGEWVIQPIYDAVSDFDNDSKIARVRTGDDWKFIRLSGETFNIPDANKIGEFSNGLAWAKVGELHGFVNTEGSWVVEPMYVTVKDFTNNAAFVRKGDLWGMINVKGELILDIKYTKIGDLREGMIFIREGDLVGVANYAGEVIEAPKYKEVKDYYDGYATVNIGNKWGLIDLKGNMVLQPEYEDLVHAAVIK